MVTNGSFGQGGTGMVAGGGGYYGGGGAAADGPTTGVTGGGGSSWAELCEPPYNFMGGANSGNGQIRISWR